jgi:hypothetical protein
MHREGEGRDAERRGRRLLFCVGNAAPTQSPSPIKEEGCIKKGRGEMHREGGGRLLLCAGNVESKV